MRLAYLAGCATWGVLACGSSSSGPQCRSEIDCLAQGPGTCQATGACSYPDPTCDRGERYGGDAPGGLAGRCLEEVDTASRCGALGELCCEGAVCGPSATCDQGVCRCGGPDQACCADGDVGVCAAGLSCTGGRCACGGPGQACCQGGVCEAALTCGSNGMCECGLEGQSCCADLSCGDFLRCDGDTCECGARAEPCCGGTVCEANLACHGDACTCGAVGEPCCDGTTCLDAATSCQTGLCAPCGGSGQGCCTSGTPCTAANTSCQGGTCQSCVPSGGGCVIGGAPPCCVGTCTTGQC